jgi:predicted nucleic acid-binding protein
VSLYLDASLLVALFVIDPLNARAEAFLSRHLAVAVVSDFAAAEFSSAIARRVRTHELTDENARLAFARFDLWSVRTASREGIISSDIEVADRILRRLELPLRTPDAIHVAVAQRLAATLATFDRQMAESARTLGIPVVTP